MGRRVSPKGSRTVLGGGKGGDSIKALPIAIFAKNRIRRDDVFCFKIKEASNCSDHTVLLTARQELQQGRCGNHRRQYADHTVRRLRSQQQLSGSII